MVEMVELKTQENSHIFTIKIVRFDHITYNNISTNSILFGPSLPTFHTFPKLILTLKLTLMDVPEVFLAPSQHEILIC